ncbi:MAG: DUF72 domain-containing protein, partial [Mucilaginibacter sp.]|nr:DUF72 domain-containing protein [Mucilaginibacter sp.]
LIYSEDEISKWNAQISETANFKFCPRFPQTITHIRRLINAEEPTAKFYESLQGFKNHLGVCILQLSDNFSPKSFPALKSYIESLDKSIKIAVEIRNKNWFADLGHRTSIFNLLSENGIGTVISDTSGRRDVVHMELTTKDACIRFVGNDLDSTDYKRMDDWIDRIKTWADNGLENLWFFMHQNDEKHVPQACVYFIKQLNAKLGTNVTPPILICQ